MAGLDRDDYRLVVPENVELRFDIAGVGSRVAAALLDYVILYTGIIAAIIAVTLNRTFLRELLRGSELPDWIERFLGPSLTALVFLAMFFAWWGYFLLFELLWGGQTPGKRMFGLRVARRDGQPVSAMASVIRNIVRAVDMFVLLGLVVMFIDRHSRRLGDLAAGTVVVREPRGGGRQLIAPVAIPEVEARARVLAPAAAQLTMEHYSLIREYFTRASNMPGQRSRALADTLARELATPLGVPLTEIGEPEQFLAAAANAFELHHQYYESTGDRRETSRP